jgi:hypothetical protein
MPQVEVAKAKEESDVPVRVGAAVADVRALRKVKPEVASAEPAAVTEVEAERGIGRYRIALAAAAVVAVVVAVILMTISGRFRSVLLHEGDPVLLTVIQNRTNDKALDGVVSEGL